MKALLTATLTLFSLNATAMTYTLEGNCLDNVNTAIADSYDGEDTGCVTGASSEEVLSFKSGTIEVTYGRHVCEGYITGTARIGLGKIKSITSKKGMTLSECEVRSFEILEESGD